MQQGISAVHPVNQLYTLAKPDKWNAAWIFALAACGGAGWALGHELITLIFWWAR